MSSIGLNTGLRALLTAQSIMDTIGHNISNANTPGYTRQRVQRGVANAIPVRGMLIGNGVNATLVERSVNSMLSSRILGQTSASGRLRAQLNRMAEIETTIGEPNGVGLGSMIDDFFSGVSSLSGNPHDSIFQTSLVQSSLELAGQFRQVAGNLGSLDQEISQDLGRRVDDVNSLSSEIARMNVEIMSIQATGAPANDLLDQRDMLLRELSELADVTTQAGNLGSMRVYVGGSVLVGVDRAYRMELATAEDGSQGVRVEGTQGTTEIRSGAIGGLINLSTSFAGSLSKDLNDLAHNLILAVNREHSTGVPADGAFSRLVGEHGLEDTDLDGDLRDELLSGAGLPFEISSGVLHVNITQPDGELVKHQVQVDAARTTVGDFLDDLNAIDGLTADVNAFGQTALVANAGYRFDFSSRLDDHPDDIGSFGGGRASLSTSAGGPFNLAPGDTIDLSVGGTSFSVVLDAADFENISQATAEELVAAINADPSVQSNGMVASEVDGRLVLQTVGSGSGESFTLQGGTALAGLGLSGQAGNTISGNDRSIEINAKGIFTGEHAGTYTFVPNMDGTIGTTPGLNLQVFTQSGELIATLNVGESYEPGTDLPVAEGVSISFGLGSVSASNGDFFAMDLTLDSDTSDVLVGLGLNSFFSGTGAEDIDLRTEIERDPGLIASSKTGAEGDNTALLRILDIQNQPLEGLDESSLGNHYGKIASTIGFEVRSVSTAFDTSETLLSTLETQRQQVSGVNVDEELVDLLKFEQAFAAAAEYISIVNQLQDELLAII